MKNRILFLGLLFIIILNYSFSQSTHIPDDVFEQTIIELGYDNGPLDNYVKTSRIDKIIYLDLKGKKIKNLDGIEDFLNLQTLVCDSNLLIKLKETKSNIFNKLEARNKLIKVIDTSIFNTSSGDNPLVITINKY